MLPTVVTGTTERGLPTALPPGGGGSITAENDNKYFDENDTWLHGEEEQEVELLEEGAGRV